MKKALILFLTWFFLMTQATVWAEENEMLTNEWTIEITTEEIDRAAAAFNRCIAEGSGLEMTEVMARQSAEDTLYALLCRTDCQWEIVYLSVPSEGDPVLLREDVLVSAPNLPVCGGMGPIWNSAVFMENDDQVIEKAISCYMETEMHRSMKDVRYRIIGGQIVAGANYRILCRIPATDTLPGSWKLMTVYADLDGNGTVDVASDYVFSVNE